MHGTSSALRPGAIRCDLRLLQTFVAIASDAWHRIKGSCGSCGRSPSVTNLQRRSVPWLCPSEDGGVAMRCTLKQQWPQCPG
ncbi:unnamed protein product [Lampetra planeri]